MSKSSPEIIHKTFEKALALTTRLTIQDREEIFPLLDSIEKESRGTVTGPPFAILYWNTGVAGIEIEAGFPVSSAVDTATARTRVLEEMEAFTTVHTGPYAESRQSYSRLYTQMYGRGIPASLVSREVFLRHDPSNPEKNVTEIQVVIHDWDHRLAEATERVLGSGAREHVMCGLEFLSPHSTREERTRRVREAVTKLEELANDEQKYDILSSCAHIFPEERIRKLRGVYEQAQDLHAVLTEMAEDPEWYESPILEGTTIRVEKVPYNREAYDTAKTDEDRKKAYCHCPMVRGFLKETPPSFCHCGSGWYRRLWEGIIQIPVRIEILKSLTKGDDLCEFAIHLPSQLGSDQQKGEQK